jgi:hypothetical protein
MGKQYTSQEEKFWIDAGNGFCLWWLLAQATCTRCHVQNVDFRAGVVLVGIRHAGLSEFMFLTDM